MIVRGPVSFSGPKSFTTVQEFSARFFDTIRAHQEREAQPSADGARIVLTGEEAGVDLGERGIEEDDAQRPAIVTEAGEVAVRRGEQGHVGDKARLSLGQLRAPGQAALLILFRSEDGDGDLVPLAVVQGGGEMDGIPASRIGAVILLHSLT